MALIIDATCRPCGSVAHLAACSHDMREVLGSSLFEPCVFLPCGIWWLSMSPYSGCKRQRECLLGSGRWIRSSVGSLRVFVRYARGPWFEFRSAHELFCPLEIGMHFTTLSFPLLKMPRKVLLKLISPRELGTYLLENDCHLTYRQ